MNRTLPPQFLQELSKLGSYADGLAEALAGTDATVAVRLNGAKDAAIAGEAERVHWCDEGFYLTSRPLFAADPAWHQGRYYVQEASSMATEAAMRQLVGLCGGQGELRILDACAAPGGKTLGILEAAGGEAFIVANEPDRLRANILAENICRRGAANVAITRGPAQVFGKMPDAFDIIAADVPCSGEGMMRKEEVAVSQWSPRLVAECAALQKDILAALWTALRPGGYLLYSTCTFNIHEDEENIRWLMDTYGAESVDLDLAGAPGVRPSVMPGVSACRFFPGQVRGEGLFVAAVRKPGDAGTPRYPAAPREDASARKFLNTYLSEPEKHTALTTGSAIEAVPKAHAAFATRLRRCANTLRAGLPVAEMKGREPAPTHELALSTVLRPGAIPAVDLPYRAAMAYLRGEAMTDLHEGMPRGYILPSFGGWPLGLAKCVGARANNLYPAPQRLRLGNDALPPEPPRIIEL